MVEVCADLCRLQVHAHKAILASRSEYFRSMFSSGMSESRQKEIELKDVRCSVFQALIEYIYTDCVDLTAETAVEVCLCVSSRAFLSVACAS